MTEAELEYELCLKEQLAMLQRSYNEAATPIVKRLVDLYAMQPSRPFIIDASLVTTSLKQGPSREG